MAPVTPEDDVMTAALRWWQAREDFMADHAYGTKGKNDKNVAWAAAERRLVDAVEAYRAALYG